MQKRGFEKVSLTQWQKDTTLPTEREYDEIVLPKRATSHSAGYDIFSPLSFHLEPGQDIKFPLGWKVYMQEDEFLMIVPRSGLGFKYYIRLANSLGVIDSDFFNNSGNEGHCWIKLRNEGNIPLSIEKGDAVAQAIFMPFLLADSDNFEGNQRIGGFGSTGK